MITSDPPQLDTDSRYKVDGYDGVAFYLLGYKEIKDEDFEWTGIMHYDTEWVRAVMVGDDAVHEVEWDSLTQISDDDYCPECGQIGCTAYQLDGMVD